MFSTQQLQMLDAVLNAHQSELVNGSLYYVAYTTNTTDNDADLLIALSSMPITTTDGYTYYFDADSYTLVSCYTSNYYSGNYYSGKRVSSTAVDSKILAVNIREFVSTNVTSETFVTFDYYDRGEIQNAQIIKTGNAMCIILCVVLLYTVLSRFIGRVFGSG